MMLQLKNMPFFTNRIYYLNIVFKTGRVEVVNHTADDIRYSKVQMNVTELRLFPSILSVTQRFNLSFAGLHNIFLNNFGRLIRKNLECLARISEYASV